MRCGLLIGSAVLATFAGVSGATWLITRGRETLGLGALLGTMFTVAEVVILHAALAGTDHAPTFAWLADQLPLAAAFLACLTAGGVVTWIATGAWLAADLEVHPPALLRQVAKEAERHGATPMRRPCDNS